MAVNPIEVLSPIAANLLVQVSLAQAMPAIPDPTMVSPVIPPMDPMNPEITPEMSQFNPSSESMDILKAETEAAKQQQINSVSNASKDNPSLFQEKLDTLGELGLELGYLTLQTADLAVTLALIPPALIVTTPMGPGVSANLAPALLKNLKQQGDNCAARYDKVENLMSKLGLPTLAAVAGGIALLSLVPGVGDAIATVGKIIGIITAALMAAKPLILMVGSSVGGAEGAVPTIPIPEVSTPTPYTCANSGGASSASSCLKYKPADPNAIVKACGNCLNYSKK